MRPSEILAFILTAPCTGIGAGQWSPNKPILVAVFQFYLLSAHARSQVLRLTGGKINFRGARYLLLLHA